MSMRLGHSDDDLAENHEINVTPFIDVMLVLLVIFMITAPLMTVDVPVNLPVANAEQKPPETDPVYLTLKADYTVAVGEEIVDRRNVGGALNTATKGDQGRTIFVRADKTVEYGEFMSLMNDLRDLGFTRYALVGVERTDGGPF